ncbi:hypothetical protein WMQ40_00195 [Vibrio diabolicus]|uniref:hypothetical protein n=1 Tax=Vibrio diabolicus TaxID=50719 RepID=UPI0029D7AB36|nr:hypothetical protein [Vibrio parahaemolyticus]EJG1091308.1 hypothetical protein [Vibrio parahaemolyticus]EJG1727744.1 hypothetical protein [Vibrio parahaemolyticus]HCH2796943.1 hypothetical protein [Vibrio parahaemolyticus]
MLNRNSDVSAYCMKYTHLSRAEVIGVMTTKRLSTAKIKIKTLDDMLSELNEHRRLEKDEAETARLKDEQSKELLRQKESKRDTIQHRIIEIEKEITLIDEAERKALKKRDRDIIIARNSLDAAQDNVERANVRLAAAQDEYNRCFKTESSIKEHFNEKRNALKTKITKLEEIIPTRDYF